MRMGSETLGEVLGRGSKDWRRIREPGQAQRDRGQRQDQRPLGLPAPTKNKSLAALEEGRSDGKPWREGRKPLLFAPVPQVTKCL